ncbi:Ig-like domain-containing protein [Reichenbachiella carrageenanivorans]|uniref:Ig-like domain-containing protein n=1 Tax=Reichenbachiella carrageenanivorans TaxID=2979869 RepID=A0ABY6D115_9BACT|nr:Ig-like domain-containing protein [Reichenbachiella carrageenanivorans]UXX79852.1 Ig-like domain-containing protein [Reichenbachiella carrageenanivorans]
MKNMIKTTLGLVFCMVIFNGCYTDESVQSDDRSISISPWQTPVTMAVDDTIQFEAYSLPNGISEEVEWSLSESSKEFVELGADGKVIAKKNGLAVVYAKSVHLDWIDSSYVVVTDQDIYVESISVSPQVIDIASGKQGKIAANTLPAAVDSLGLVAWSSEDPSIATVAEDGTITGVSVGETQIVATVKNYNNDDITASASVTVHPLVKLTSLIISPSTLYLKEGNETSVEISYTPDNANDTTWVWTSANENVVTIDEHGVVKAEAIGVTTISVSNGSFTSNSMNVDVSAPILVTGVKIMPDQTNVEFRAVGESLQLSAELMPVDASNQNVNWSVDDNSVVSVSASGLITAVGEGTAIVTVTSENGGFIDTIEVVVKFTETYYEYVAVSNLATLDVVSVGTHTVVSNPNVTGINTNATVGKFVKAEGTFSFMNFLLPDLIDIDNYGDFKFWALVEDPGKIVTNNRFTIILRNENGLGAGQVSLFVDVDIANYGKWVEYEIDFSNVVPQTDYKRVYMFFGQPDTDLDATGMVYYIDNLRGPFLQ